MSGDTPLPTAVEARELLEGLLGRGVEVTLGAAAVDPSAPGGAVVGSYVDDRLRLRALVVMDLSLAAHSGAAIALIPAQTARTAVEGRLLTPGLLENAAEILNVAAALFHHDGAPHVRLDATYAPSDTLPADLSPWVLAYVRRLDLDVAIAGYDAGRLSILAL